MLTEVFYISLTGIGVVFSFLFIIFLLLKGLKFFAVAEETVEKKVKQRVPSSGAKTDSEDDEISPEVIAAITAVLNEEGITATDKISIRKKRRQ